MSIIKAENRENVLFLWLDADDSKVNTLRFEDMPELEKQLDRLEQDNTLEAAVLISRKKDFMVGADIHAFDTFSDKKAMETSIDKGHALLNRLEACKKPIVAAIQGNCMGAGLEIVLACHYRLITNDAKLALPEVKLGLLPGLGGTQRLPRTIGLEKGLQYALTGKTIYAKQAKRMGLAAASIHRSALEDAAFRAAQGLAAGTIKPKKRKLNAKTWLLEKTPLSRIVFNQAEKMAAKQSKGKYPAPERIISTVREGWEDGLEEGFDSEAEHFAELIFTPESKALRHLFFAQNAAKKNPHKDKIKTVESIGVLGAGLMGAGIAEVSAKSNYRVTLKDINLENARKAIGGIAKSISKRVGKGLTAFQRDQALSRITPSESYERFSNVQMTIEAVLEIPELKQQVLKDVEAHAPEGHIFASNTSSIPISSIAAASKNPSSVLGMHYFSPVPKMPLLEIITTDKTADWALATAYDVGLKQGKTPIVVGDKPGFYTTRIISIYMNEALILLEEGVSIPAIDRAMKDFGFPVGPVKLIDEIGMDVGAKIGKVLGDFVGERIGINTLFSRMMDAELLGRKSGAGFYNYGADRGVNAKALEIIGAKEAKELSSQEIQDRLAFTMMNEAVHCLQEDVLKSPSDGDVSAVFGLGFPPFLGGPFWYMDALGIDKVVERLQELEKTYGKRFAPAQLLVDYAKEGKDFF